MANAIGVGLAVLLLAIAVIAIVRNYAASGRRPRRLAITVARGSAPAIRDAGVLSNTSIVEALKIRDEDPDPYSENPEAHQFGLRPSNDSWAGYHSNLMIGERNGRQVYVRVGHDDKIESGLSGRHLRQIVVVRALLPSFDLHSADGRLVPGVELPVAVHDVVSALSPAPDVWTDLRIAAGPDGIVSNRPQWKSVHKVQEYTNAWAYDLWLLERICDRLAAPALPPVDLADLEVPYGMGKQVR